MARPRSFDKEKVLNAAKEIFWKKGFADTSISDLEGATGLKRTSLYAAFGNKQNLYKQTLDSYQKESQVFVDTCFNHSTNPIKNIQHFLVSSVINTLNDPERKGCFIQNSSIESPESCQQNTSFIHNNKNLLIKKLSKQIALAKKLNNLKTDKTDKQLAHYLFSFHNGLIASIKSGSNKKELLDSIKIGLENLK